MKIHTHEMNTPLGPMVAGVYQDKLCFLEFSDRKNFEKQMKHLERLTQHSRLQLGISGLVPTRLV